MKFSALLPEANSTSDPILYLSEEPVSSRDAKSHIPKFIESWALRISLYDSAGVCSVTVVLRSDGLLRWFMGENHCISVVVRVCHRSRDTRYTLVRCTLPPAYMRGLGGRCLPATRDRFLGDRTSASSCDARSIFQDSTPHLRLRHTDIPHSAILAENWHKTTKIDLLMILTGFETAINL